MSSLGLEDVLPLCFVPGWEARLNGTWVELWFKCHGEWHYSRREERSLYDALVHAAQTGLGAAAGQTEDGADLQPTSVESANQNVGASYEDKAEGGGE